MVYLNKEQLAEVEFLFNQSAQGLHILFENDEIKRVLSCPTEDSTFFTFENVEKIQKLLADFVNKKTISEKRHFLRGLDSDQFDLLLRTYFNIVENSIFEQSKLRH